MRLQIIGCHGSVEPGYLTTCYAINEQFYVDAGSLASTLTPEEQGRVTDVFLTHPHLDHVKDLCFLIENSADHDRPTLTLHSTAEILDDIHRHVFNDVIWPDFSKISIHESGRPLLRFSPLPADGKRELCGVKLTAFKVNHPGHAVGYLLDDGMAEILLTGDTGPCAEIWQVANRAKRLKAIFTEISFPSRLDQLARISGHYTLEQLLTDLAQLRHADVPIFISHFKPRFVNELLNEFHRRAPANLRLLHEGDEFNFG